MRYSKKVVEKPITLKLTVVQTSRIVTVFLLRSLPGYYAPYYSVQFLGRIIDRLLVFVAIK